MSFFKRKSAVKEAVAGGDDSSMFGVTRDQLTKLMKLQGKELIEKLNSSEYNGIEGILEKLKVHTDKGLDSNNQQDLQQRRTAYGKNEIPPKPISFLQLSLYVFTSIITSFLLTLALIDEFEDVFSCDSLFHPHYRQKPQFFILCSSPKR